jgi:hypothetical protein
MFDEFRNEINEIIKPQEDTSELNIMKELFATSNKSTLDTKIKAFVFIVCFDSIKLRDESDVDERYHKLLYGINIAVKIFLQILNSSFNDKELITPPIINTIHDLVLDTICFGIDDTCIREIYNKVITHVITLFYCQQIFIYN